jgi:hypothetical protein
MRATMRSLVSFLFFLAFSHVSSFSPHSWVSTKRVESLSRLHDAAIIFRKDSEQLVEDGGVSKSIISTGTGRKVEIGDILAVEYNAAVVGSDTPFAKGSQEQFVLCDGTMIKGFDIAVSSMCVGEKAVFLLNPAYAYGTKGIEPVIPSESQVNLEVKVLAWLGNEQRPETLFQKDLDIDPFVSSTPEAIQADYDQMQANKSLKPNGDMYEGSIFDIYLRRLKNTAFGFGGSGFFVSQTGEAAPWYLNPNITFPIMILVALGAFATVLFTGSVREKGEPRIDPELAMIRILKTDEKQDFLS